MTDSVPARSSEYLVNCEDNLKHIICCRFCFRSAHILTEPIVGYEVKFACVVAACFFACRPPALVMFTNVMVVIVYVSLQDLFQTKIDILLS